jgi:hypothetical protein
MMHLNIPVARGSQDWRFDVNLPVEEIPIYLERIGWPGDLRRLEPFYPIFSEDCGRFSVQVDMADDILPQLAWEHFRSSDDLSAPTWRRFLGAMVAHKLCAPDRVEDLLRWPGSSEGRSKFSPWPLRLVRQMDVKMVLRPDHIYAKSYLMWSVTQELFKGITAGITPAIQEDGIATPSSRS